MNVETESKYMIHTGRHYLIYTDGACRPNPGSGGWSAILQLRIGEEIVKELELSGFGSAATTNSRMELTAALKALGKLREKDIPITVRSDSKYLVEGMSKWMTNWKRYEWRVDNGKGKPVLNQDLWQALDAMTCTLGPITWEWVRGHAGDRLNERCDRLASQAIDNATRLATAA